jgi:2-oxoglutarate decarboxylase
VGATVSLTNPGTLGTVQSVPRLMAGQGAIFGVGALGWPSGFEAADPRALAELGVGKVLTLTSTYDHRIIQGAESGLFLKYVAECLTGEHEFYDEVFASLGVALRAGPLGQGPQPGRGEDDHERILKQIRVQELINMYRMRGHLNAHLDPLHSEPPALHSELDLATYGLTMWDLQRRFVVSGLAGRTEATLEEILVDPARRVLPHYGHRIRPHHGPRAEALDPRARRRRQGQCPRRATPDPRSAQRGRGLRAFPALSLRRPEAIRPRRRESTIVALRTVLDVSADQGTKEAVIGMAHRGRLNVLANVVGKSYSDIFSEFEGNLDPESVQGSGDVKYHKGARGVYKNPAAPPSTSPWRRTPRTSKR